MLHRQPRSSQILQRILTFAKSIRQHGHLAVAISCGVLMTPFNPVAPEAAFAQGNIDLVNGNSVSIGPKSSSPSAKVIDKKARPSIGMAFDVDETTDAFKFARREYEKQIRKIRFRYIGGNKKKHAPTLARGLSELERFTEATSVLPMIEILRRDGDAVREWLMEHLRYRVAEPYGQATLTWLSIFDEEVEMRDLARSYLDGPANRRSQYMVSKGLRLLDHDTANDAALAAGQFKLVEAIPLLIATQAVSSASGSTQGDGALAFIQVQTQTFFVSDLQPVVGTSSVGFDPQLSTISDGTIVVIDDAIVVFPRNQVHNTLLDLVRADYGQPVNLGYDTGKWREWYQNEYLPYKQAKKDAQMDQGQGNG